MSKNPLKILRDLFGAKSRSEAADVIEHAAPGYKARIDEANRATLRTGNEHAFSSRPLEPGWSGLMEGNRNEVVPEMPFSTTGGALAVHHTHPINSPLPSGMDVEYFSTVPGLYGRRYENPGIYSISKPGESSADPVGHFLTTINYPEAYWSAKADELTRDIKGHMRGIARPFEALRPSAEAREALGGRQFMADDTASKIIRDQLTPYLTLRAMERLGQAKNFLDLPPGQTVTGFDDHVTGQFRPFTDPARARDVLDDLETRSKRLLGFRKGGLARAAC